VRCRTGHRTFHLAEKNILKIISKKFGVFKNIDKLCQQQTTNYMQTTILDRLTYGTQAAKEELAFQFTNGLPETTENLYFVVIEDDEIDLCRFEFNRVEQVNFNDGQFEFIVSLPVDENAPDGDVYDRQIGHTTCGGILLVQGKIF
jgi:hypothetical protein